MVIKLEEKKLSSTPSFLRLEVRNAFPNPQAVFLGTLVLVVGISPSFCLLSLPLSLWVKGF